MSAGSGRRAARLCAADDQLAGDALGFPFRRRAQSATRGRLAGQEAIDAGAQPRPLRFRDVAVGARQPPLQGATIRPMVRRHATSSSTGAPVDPSRSAAAPHAGPPPEPPAQRAQLLPPIPRIF